MKYDTLQVIYDIRSVPPWNTTILTIMRTCMSTTFPTCTTKRIPTTKQHNHTHSHDAANGHGHVHENTQAVLNRLSRAIGHLESVRKMVADGRDCSEVLIQIAAVRAAITNIGKVILQDHIQHCIGRRCRARRRAGPRRAVSGDRQVCEITKAPPGLCPRSGVPKTQRAASRRDSPALIFMELLCGAPLGFIFSGSNAGSDGALRTAALSRSRCSLRKAGSWPSAACGCR